MAKTLGYDYFTLARGACSNSAIRLQIDEMIKRKVDFVVVGTTSSARIDYPLKDKPFDYNLGVYNLAYNYHPDLSSLDINFIHDNMASDTIHNILEGYAVIKNEEQLESIRRYLIDIYDNDFRYLQDAWIISDGIRALKEANIPYIVLLLQYFARTNVSTFTNHDPRIIHDMNNKDLTYLLPYNYGTYDEETGEHTTRRYHVSDKNQVVIAENLCNYIKTNNLLVWS